MKKFLKLMELCKGEISLTINEHRSSYMSVRRFFEDIIFMADPDVRNEIDLDKMVDQDTIIELQFYPITPVGFYRLFGTDLDQILDKALEILE